MKRLVDLSIGGILFLVLSPLMLLIAIAIVLESGHPAFYAPVAIGQYGKPFRFLRFRTMRDDPDQPVSRRLTRVGRMIRNLSLDHLPNLYNLLMGHISLIGPRPTEPERVNLNDPDWQHILCVRPGILSYAVLMLAKDFNSTSQAERNKLELEYIKKQSLSYDVNILLASLKKWVASGGNIKARGIPTRSPADNVPTQEGD